MFIDIKLVIQLNIDNWIVQKRIYIKRVHYYNGIVKFWQNLAERTMRWKDKDEFNGKEKVRYMVT